MKVLFFDGYCSMCNSVVDWGMRHDHKRQMQFASLQGNTAYQKLPQSYLSLIETVVYLREDEIYERSDAILFFLKDLGRPWSWFLIFRIIPKPLRDLIYNLVAKNRYLLFKKREACRVPTEAERERLLD